LVDAAVAPRSYGIRLLLEASCTGHERSGDQASHPEYL